MLEALTDLQTPDETLVRRVLARAIFRPVKNCSTRHRGESYRYAYRLLGNEQDALDVVQDAMLKAFSALKDFDGRSGFRTWLLRIVINTAYDWGRRRKRRPGAWRRRGRGVGQSGAGQRRRSRSTPQPARPA